MTTHNVWEEDFRVFTFHMDPKGKAHFTSICNFLQEGASMHAESAGFGFEDMMRRSQVWVLTRLKVIVKAFPVWKDQLSLKTWSRGKNGIFYVRDFTIENDQNEILVNATSSWAAINIKTRKPELVDGLEDGLHSLKDKKAINENLGKIPNPTNPKLLRKRTVEYTDIDIVYHVNNVKYIELIVNSFSKEIHMSKNLKEIEINYLGEATYGEEIGIYSEQTGEDTYLVGVVREKDNKDVCRAKLVWK